MKHKLIKSVLWKWQKSRNSPHKIVGGMATMPTRSKTAPTAIASALNNIDHLYLFLDKFDKVPSYAINDRITILRSEDYGEIGANGKFLGLALATNAQYYMCFDDDYLYPYDFSKRLVAECRRYHNNSIIGIHGCILQQPFTSFLKDRIVFRAPLSLESGRRVDVLATLGLILSLQALTFDVRRWQQINMVDLSFALEAKKKQLPLRIISRQTGWLQVLDKGQPDSIWKRVQMDDTAQSLLARELLG